MAIASTSAGSSVSVLPQNLPAVCEDCWELGVLGGENKRGGNALTTSHIDESRKQLKVRLG